ncbi:MAG TPA: Asp-tRNA(Asn)/Glu-tRNA(Gln) amidotransferase subunit GatA [Longimicrobiales bacterium]|nr:Asp-tRNA(Asn)/Glu-tRNA(Gln) amidotransferase subunit GatA [Longimicrobiales bacterium]
MTEESAAAIARAVSSGTREARSTIAGALERVGEAARTGGLNAILSVGGDAAMRRASEVDALAREGRVGRLAGVPVAVKDNLCTLDMPTTCGSRILEGWVSPYEATVVRRLHAAGAVVVAKTNMDEFAMGSSTENSAYGPTLNPHDRTRVPGGSSGGSAAAVAAGLVPVALGSDTGGSVRQPASFCGVVGIKPTWGRVSRYGLVAFASSLDQVGTFGRTVSDATLVLDVISGHDPLDATSDRRDAPVLADALQRGLDGLTVGVPREYYGEGLDAAVRTACDRAITAMRSAGAIIRPVSLPSSRFAIPAYYIIAPAEASSNLARYDGVRYGPRPDSARTTADVWEMTRAAFGPEVKRRVMLGTFVLSAGYQDRYYHRAQQVRRTIAGDIRRVFADGVDVLFTPTAPAPPFGIGERVDDPYRMYLSDVYTVTANLAGTPALSLPIGEAAGLPVGGQFIADVWREDLMVRAAAGLEAALTA